MAELKAQVKTVHDQATANEKQVIELKAQLKTTTMEKEKLKDEKLKAEAVLQEKERTQGFLDKQMEIFNVRDFLLTFGVNGDNRSVTIEIEIIS